MLHILPKFEPHNNRVLIASKTKPLINGIFLPLMESCYTIQGEGKHAGKAAYFIRLGGCDVGCHWCDVKESWKVDASLLTSVDEIIQMVAKSSAQIAVITGGEPLMHDLAQLTDGLVKQELHTHLETSGAYPLSGTWHWICLSPKKTAPPVGDISLKADELKVIVGNKDDLMWAEEQAMKVSTKCLLYLQPEWSRSKKMLPLLVDYVKNNPQWNISLQLHKYMNIP